MQNLKKLIELVAYKKQLDHKRAEPKFTDNEWLLDAIIAEVKEVKEEMKPNNDFRGQTLNNYFYSINN